TGALKDAAKIFQADKMQARAANARVTEGVEDGENERSANQQHDIQNGWAEHGHAQPRALRRAHGLDLRGGYCHVSALGATLFSVLRSKNFRWRSATANSYLAPISKLCPSSRRAITVFPSALPPSKTPARMNSAPRYSTFSTRYWKVILFSLMSSDKRKCS